MFILFSFLTFTSSLFASPMNGLSPENLLKSHIGHYRSRHGFTIHADKTDWTHLAAPQSQNQHIATIYKGPLSKEGVRAALTVRVDDINYDTTVSKYVKKWKQDYPRLGFQVLSAKRIKVTGQQAYLFDLLNNSNERQIRQVLFLKKRKVVTLTCRDHRSSFQKQVKACNQIIKNFKWM